jgi:hypothetical protein
LNTKKFFTPVYCAISNKKSGSNGTGMGWPLMLLMMMMSSDGKAGVLSGQWLALWLELVLI